MDLTQEQYAVLHQGAFGDDEYISDIVSAKSYAPDRATWREFESVLPEGPLLEIGPGTGHFLAAAREARREVYAIESSSVHREFVRRTWGIEAVASLEDLPRATPPFASVVMFNTIEHVFDVAALFLALRERLRAGAVVFVSTCNADCIIVPVVGVYWSMFKPPDHVSIPSADGFRRLAPRVGLSVSRVWTGELPLETPIGLATAARDYLLEHRAGPPVPGGEHATQDGPAATPAAKAVLRRIVRGAMDLTSRVDPTRRITTRMGKAAAIRALFRRDA